MIDTSIVFVLDDTLTVYEAGEFVNQLICLEKDGNGLNLPDKIKGIWSDLDTKYTFSQYDNFVLIIGPNAGFTDSRMVYIWLKGIEFFEGKKLLVSKVHSVDNHAIHDYVKLAKATPRNSLSYSKEPRIGKAK